MSPLPEGKKRLRILLLNQAFYPDVVATAQHLTELAVELSARGHCVTAVSGACGYDDASRRYSSSEEYKGVRILRVRYARFGKKTRLSRALDFASFYAGLALRLATLPRQDVVVALTSPPLVATVASWFCRWKGGRLVYWVMDMNPDEAVAAGWLSERSRVARALRAMNRAAFRASARIVALDRYMARRIERDYGGDPERIAVLPPWGNEENVRPVPPEANAFRREHGLDGKFVVMYSGNHSPCHPLDTVLEAAARLAGDPGVLFCFVGGGSLVGRVRDFVREKKLGNVLQLPYQPASRLSDSLSAGDLHVAVMGEAFVGIVHPCKVYGILAAGRPFVFVGPADSAMGDLVREIGVGRRVPHGDVDGFLRAVAEARAAGPDARVALTERTLAAKERFSKGRLAGELVKLIENAAAL